MSSAVDRVPRRSAPALGMFERYLTVWVALCIVTGIVLGQLLPGPFQALGRMTIAEVNIPVAILIWLMIVPMLLKVDFGALHRVAEQWRGIAVTVGINWLIKPFSMAALGWLFIGWLFRSWLPAAQIDSYIAGLIILAAAPCTAMVFVWSNLTDGDPNFTLSQVALNDTIMVFAFAPIVGLLLGLSSITVPWPTLFLSVVLYIVVPVIAAQLWRRSLLANGGEPALAGTLRRLQPVSLVALLATLGAAVRVPGRTDCAAAARDCAARRPDRDPSLPERRDCLCAESSARSLRTMSPAHRHSSGHQTSSNWQSRRQLPCSDFNPEPRSQRWSGCSLKSRSCSRSCVSCCAREDGMSVRHNSTDGISIYVEISPTYRRWSGFWPTRCASARPVGTHGVR